MKLIFLFEIFWTSIKTPSLALPRSTRGGERERESAAISASGAFSVEDGEIAVGHLQNNQGHGGAIVWVYFAFPVAGGFVLAVDEKLADGGIPLGPVFSAGEEHGLDGVVLAVEEMALFVDLVSAGDVSGEEVESAGDAVVFEFSGVVEGGGSGGGSGEAGFTAGGLVAETAVGILAALHVGERFVHDAGVGFDAGVARGAEGHDLADGDGDVGVERSGLVAPAAFGVLAALDEADGFLQVFLDFIVAGHSINLADEKRGEAVGIHFALAGVGGEESGFLLVADDELDGFADVVAVFSATGEVTVGHEGDAGESGDGGGSAVRDRVSEGAFDVLL